jgi:hypothetical protein
LTCIIVYVYGVDPPVDVVFPVLLLAADPIGDVVFSGTPVLLFSCGAAAVVFPVLLLSCEFPVLLLSCEFPVLLLSCGAAAVVFPVLLLSCAFAAAANIVIIRIPATATGAIIDITICFCTILL